MLELNILLLCNKPDIGVDANTIIDHISAVENYSQHNIYTCSNLGDFPRQLKLEKFDVIIIHYSICLLHDRYLSRDAKKNIREYKGLKVIFIQDEYRQINKIVQELRYLDVNVLFTCFPELEIENIYPEQKLPGVKKYNNLTGYVPEKLLSYQHSQLVKRPIDVGYRARKVPFWLGELSFGKWDIVEQWKKNVTDKSFKIDISYKERDRFYGSKWLAFLSSCKATLGVESGASVFDFTGEIEMQVNAHQALHPKDTFREVQKKYLANHENKHYLNQISPRCFEAIALKTALVLYEGEYSGILKPDRHYISLKKDYSNIDEVLEQIKDTRYLQKMVDIAYEEIALNSKYSYKNFIEKLDGIISKSFEELRLEKILLN